MQIPAPFTDPTEGKKIWVNPYVKLLKENYTSQVLPALSGPQLLGKKGAWKAYFKEVRAMTNLPQNLMLEIGCHLGKNLVEIAEDCPLDAIIGIDIRFKRVVCSAKKLHAKNLNNAVCALEFAQNIEHLFEPGELDVILVFFPDPWTKKRQRKNRILNEDSLRLFYSLLAPGGRIWLKTDQREYFLESCQFAEKAGFLAQEPGPEPLFVNGYESTFESYFSRQNLPVYSATLVKA